MKYKMLDMKSEWQNNSDISWIDTNKPIIAFTFDDGTIGNYEGSSSTRILDVFDKYNIHCTVFYVGNKINDSNKNEIERAYKLDCEIGNHTFSHRDLTQLTTEEITAEIYDTRKKLFEIIGLENFLVRPPYGAENISVSENANAPLIIWSLDTSDWNGNYDSVTKAVTEQAKDGAIVLMHEVYDYTAEAIEYLVPYLTDKGYQIVSVSELYAVKEIKMQSGESYKGI